MAIYSTTLFYNEFDLLDLKIDEELGVVDRLYIVEANQSYQANPKELFLKNNEKYRNEQIEVQFLIDKMMPKIDTGWTPKNKNQRIQRNYSVDVIPYEDDDVIIVTDMDEINRREDISKIVDAARKYGCVRIAQRGYYYKINLARTTKKGWLGPFALTGEYVRSLKEQGQEIQDVRGNRQKISNVVETEGKHFSFLMEPELIAHKIDNFSHNEFNRVRFKDLEQIQYRIDNLIDPFDRTTKDGTLRRLFKTEIDDTYPKTILNNLEEWEKYIA
jgi:beta-1,4-mannosyl-glycoprotein beta-1,4-N-acetylglucosaminyltransferase